MKSPINPNILAGSELEILDLRSSLIEIKELSNMVRSAHKKKIAEHSNGLRVGKELLRATLPFAKESRNKSWRLVLTVFSLLLISMVGTGFAPWPWLQLVFSLCSAVLMIRAFSTFHDYMHSAILSNSSFAHWFSLFTGCWNWCHSTLGKRAITTITDM